MSHKFLRYTSIPVLSFMVLGALLSAFDVAAAGGPPPVVRYASRSDATGPLRDMPQIPPMPAVLGQIFQRPFKRLPNRAGGGGSAAPDPVVQASLPGASAPTTGNDFEGVGNVNGVLPPDPVGAIGPNHYVQMVNLSFAIWDRNGYLLEGPTSTNTLWQGFGGACESTNDGDPVVLYDHLADRWLMSQFALPNFPRGPFYQCIAVSQTGDPTGAWHRYEFTISDTKLNDYPKFGVWPDGYYMSVNQYKCNPVRCSWAGQGVAAFERGEMLSGQPARMVFFDLNNTDPNLGGMLPADLDGPAPPAGTPNPFAQVDDDAWGYTSQDQLQIWNFHVDWNNPSSSSFTFDRAVQTAAFDANMCGYSRNCIPQPGGTNVDAISDRLMYRLQYRDFGTYQTMVVNHTVDVGGDHAGIRWYELQDSGSGWGIAQAGTFAPDSDHRWMGSAAMNSAGDIALGYSVSSTNTSPSIRFTGRLGSDPEPNVMTQGEGTIVAGNGYQTHSSGRWGDYSMLSVDPTDDCTFWYTQEYYATTVGSAPWRTHIGSFQLSDCSGTVDSPPLVTITNPGDGAIVSGTVSITADASDDKGVAQVEFFVDNNSLMVDTDSADGWSASWDTTGASDGSHTISATATDSAGQTGSDGVGVTVDNVNDPPTAIFTASCIGLTCDFDASDSYDPDGSIVLYDWNFGDGNTGTGATISHTYGAAGDYPVALTVTDDGGEMGTASEVVSVSEAIAVAVDSVSPDTVAAGSSVEVTISGTGFQPGAMVSFENGSGPAPAVWNVNVADASTIYATLTAKAGGPPRDRVWDVRVTNPDGSTSALSGGFTVTP